MILGKQFFVTPSDSLAILAANSSSIIKVFLTIYLFKKININNEYKQSS